MGGTLLDHDLSFHTDLTGHSCGVPPVSALVSSVLFMRGQHVGIGTETSTRDVFSQQDAVSYELLHYLNHKYPILSLLPYSYSYRAESKLPTT